MVKNKTEKMELEKYKITLDFLKFEATSLWQIFIAFFIGNNIFIAIILAVADKDDINYFLILVMGVIGVAIAVLWLETFRRNGDWYAYRMKQARDAERIFVDSIEDKEWFLLNKDANAFADGKEIKGLKNNDSAKAMIWIFIAIYISVIFFAIYNSMFYCNC